MYAVMYHKSEPGRESVNDDGLVGWSRLQSKMARCNSVFCSCSVYVVLFGIGVVYDMPVS